MSNLLVISNWYPQLWTNRYNKNFVKEYTDLVKDKFDEVYIISFQPYFPKFLCNFKIFEKYYIHSNFSDYSYDNVKVFYPTDFTVPYIFEKKRRLEAQLKNAQEIIRNNHLKFDIIHSHFLQNWIIWSNLKKLYWNAKVILHCHDSKLKSMLESDPEKYAAMFKWIDWCISFCDNYEVINNFFDEHKIENKNVNIPNFVNVEKFYPREDIKNLRKKYWFNDSDEILICVWNIIYEHKWQNDILSIWKDLETRIENLHLLLIWNWKDKEKMLHTIKDMNAKNIHYLWAKSNEEIVDYLNISDLFVFPSRYESFWIVQIESIACWTPVIAYKNWWSEYIIKKEVWKVLDKQNVELLKKWILEMINIKYDRKYLHKCIVDNYSWEIVKEKLLNLYFN